LANPARRGTGTRKVLEPVKRPIAIPPRRWRSVKQSLGHVAVRLLEIGEAADVQPVLADEMSRNNTTTIESARIMSVASKYSPGLWPREGTITTRAASLLIGLWLLAAGTSASAQCAWCVSNLGTNARRLRLETA